MQVSKAFLPALGTAAVLSPPDHQSQSLLARCRLLFLPAQHKELGSGSMKFMALLAGSGTPNMRFPLSSLTCNPWCSLAATPALLFVLTIVLTCNLTGTPCHWASVVSSCYHPIATDEASSVKAFPTVSCGLERRASTAPSSSGSVCGQTPLRGLRWVGSLQ